MLRDDIITILHDRILYEEAEMFADRILSLPEIKQAERMREKIIKKITIGLGQYADNKTNWIGGDAKRILREVLAILKEADHE